MRSTLFAILLVLASAPLAAQPLKLNSGKTVEISTVGPMLFTKGPTALVLRYQTTLPLDDVAALRKEVDEIWQHFVGEVDRGKYEAAVIIAAGPKTGFIVKTNKTYGFGFTKVDGIWRTAESATTKDSKLTDAQLRSFYDRWDFLYSNDNEKAIALYLDKNWRLDVTGAPDGVTEISAATYVSEIQQGRGQSKLIEHRRDILKITIDAKTNTAVVECRETTRRQVKGSQVGIVERTTDTISLRDQHLLMIKSATTVEHLGGFTTP